MSVISDALKTAQREKQRRDSGIRPGSAPLVVPLRTRPDTPFSWQRAVGLGVGSIVLLAVAWYVFLRGSESGRPPKYAITAPIAVSLADPPSAQATIPTAAPDTAATPAPPIARANESPATQAAAPRRAAPVRAARRPPAARDSSASVLQGSQVGVGTPSAPDREPAQGGHLRIAVDQPREGDAARLFAIGVAAHRAGDLGAARNAYERVLLVAPNDVDALNNMGVLLAAMREFDRAEQLLRRAVRLAPRNAGAWNNLGTVLAQRGQSGDAIAAYQQALSIDPQHQGARVSLAQQHLAIGAADKAREMLESVLATNPALAEAHYALGQAFELQKDWAGAMRAYGAFVRFASPRLAGDVERVRVRMDVLGRMQR